MVGHIIKSLMVDDESFINIHIPDSRVCQKGLSVNFDVDRFAFLGDFPERGWRFSRIQFVFIGKHPLIIVATDLICYVFLIFISITKTNRKENKKIRKKKYKTN